MGRGSAGRRYENAEQAMGIRISSASFMEAEKAASHLELRKSIPYCILERMSSAHVPRAASLAKPFAIWGGPLY